jgi:RNA polymerase subunit RPABC4/transcription elongation factor Spt4
MPSLTLETALTWGIIYAGAVLVAAWLAMVIWAYRDMRARSRDLWAQMLVAVVVLVLSLPGLLIYIFLRPRETLAEAYERSLEEEALLQAIEDKPHCPGCGLNVQADWQACPNCHTRLKKPCINCGEMLQLAWELCPYCAAPQTTGAANKHAHVSRRIQTATPSPDPDEAWKQAVGYQEPETSAPAGTKPPEFLEE